MALLKNLPQRLKSCLRANKFTAGSFRGIAMGTFTAVTIGDVVIYNQLQESINHGQLPWYTTDVLIATLGSLEAFSAPVWSCLNRWRIRTLIFISLVTAVAILGLLALPSVPISAETGTELCTNVARTSVAFTSMSTAAAVRLTIIIVVALVNVICKAAVWNNALVLMDTTEAADMPLNYGILLTARIVGIIVLPKFFGEQMAVWMQVLAAFGPLLIQIFQLYRLPEPVLRKESLPRGDFDTSLAASVCRVLSSLPVMGLIFAMALLASSLWGYKWHDSDFIKMLFFVVESDDFATNQSELLYYHALVLAVVTYGLYYSKPVFDKSSAMKLATFAALVATPLYCVQTIMLSCQPGLVGGLEQTYNYTQPTCSTQCQCAFPYSQFEPVCVTDTMTTYLSPCQAGCTGTDLNAGVKSYRSCGCGLANSLQRATVGACNAVQCRSNYVLYKVVSACIVLFVVLAMQMMLVTVLRLVDPLDRPVAVGLSTAIVLFSTFCCAHLAFFFVRVSSCAWKDGDRCHLYTPTVFKAVGGMSSGLAGLASVISLVLWIVVKRTHGKVNDDISLQE